MREFWKKAGLIALGAAGPTPDASAVHRGYQFGALAMDAWRFDAGGG